LFTNVSLHGLPCGLANKHRYFCIFIFFVFSRAITPQGRASPTRGFPKMMQWIKPHARRACIISGLLAVLTGCSDSGGDVPLAKDSGTFETKQEPVVVKQVVKDETPVVATVTEVPGTEPKTPQTDGGKAIPLIDPASQIVPLVPIKARVLPRSRRIRRVGTHSCHQI
jgi:hypothetical protein